MTVDINREPVARALYCAGPCSAVTVAAWLQVRNMSLDADQAPSKLLEMAKAGKVCTRTIGDVVLWYLVGNGVG